MFVPSAGFIFSCLGKSAARRRPRYNSVRPAERTRPADLTELQCSARAAFPPTRGLYRFSVWGVPHAPAFAYRIVCDRGLRPALRDWGRTDSPSPPAALTGEIIVASFKAVKGGRKKETSFSAALPACYLFLIGG